MQRERTKSMRKFSNITHFSITHFSNKTFMCFTIGTRFVTNLPLALECFYSS